MSGQDRFDRSELERRLLPYKCRRIATIAETPAIELWETGWGEPFTLSPDGGLYDEWQWRRLIFLIRKTLPPGWSLL